MDRERRRATDRERRSRDRERRSDSGSRVLVPVTTGSGSLATSLRDWTGWTGFGVGAALLLIGGLSCTDPVYLFLSFATAEASTLTANRRLNHCQPHATCQAYHPDQKCLNPMEGLRLPRDNEGPPIFYHLLL